MAGLDDVASELESVSRHLRRAGQTELLRELNKAITDAVTPVEDKVRLGLRPRLPDQYADALNADLDLRITRSANERNPHVSLTAKSPGHARKLRYLDQGRLTHPLFGDREHWYTQEETSVQPGFFTRPAQDAAPRIRGALERALEDVAAKAASKGP